MKSYEGSETVEDTRTRANGESHKKWQRQQLYYSCDQYAKQEPNSVFDFRHVCDDING